MYFTLAALFILGYLFLFYFKGYRDHKLSPPGPTPLPLLGNLLQIAKASAIPSQAFHKFSQEFGEIYRLKMGLKDMVVITSVEAINTIFAHPEAQGRDLSGSWADRNFHKNLGIVFGDGPSWEKTKQWAIRNLREYGWGKSSEMEPSIIHEIHIFMEDLDKKRKENNNQMQISNLFILPVFKTIWTMIAGECTDEDMPVIHDLLIKSADAISKGVFGAGIVAAYPLLRFVIPEQTGHAAQMRFYTTAHQSARDLLKKSRKAIALNENKTPDNFVDAFVLKAMEEDGNPDSIFTDENFICTYMDLLQAGSDTNSAFMESFVLFMSLYPDVQEKLVQEINKCVPSGSDVTIAHKDRMIYTQAVLWEIHRHSRLVQNLVPRRITDDIRYKDYVIKEGTVMIASLYSVYFDEKTWEDPMAFKPERFIGKDGQLQKINCLTPFGVGKRLCPGEAIAHATDFLYMTNLLRRYKLTTVPGKEKPTIQMHEGFTCKPFPFEAVFLDRVHN